MMEETKKAYKDIFKILNKYKDIHVFDIRDLKRESDIHLLEIELRENYGLNIKPNQIRSLDWNKIGEHIYIAKYGSKYSRTISWSTDGRQPEDELLLCIEFPTGAFIFGYGDTFNKEYPTDFFQKFWLELKSFSPDYTDEANKGLYWNIKNAKDIFNSFDEILQKYYKLNQEDYKQRKINKMKEELTKLENS